MGTTTSTDAVITRVGSKDLILPPLRDNQLRIAVISDCHLGHARVKTGKVIQAFDRAFTDEHLKNLTHVVISGDLFDKRLAFNSEDAYQSFRWMKRFLLACKKHNVGIRILEGTPSHDNRQSYWMVAINQSASIEADIRYYDELSVDELYPGGPHVLYVPDELNHDASKTWKQVTELLRQRNLETVDFAVMHGMFTYQEPIRSVVSHSEERYESIVTQRILIGHHHTHTTSGKIRVPGSTERLRHNEEEDKGYLILTLTDNVVCEELFVINEDAEIFTTFDVVGWEYVDVLTLLRKHQHSPSGSHYRLKLSRNDPTYASLRQLKNEFPQFDLTVKTVETEDYTPDSGELIERPIVVAMRPETLPGMLRTRITDVSHDVLASIDTILTTC